MSEPEPALYGRRIYLPRGRMLGGSSSMNAMMYIRGHRSDYDRWAADDGADGWSYDEVLPYFKRSERNAEIADSYHGTSGELHVTAKRWLSPHCDRFIDSAAALGIERNPDFNGARQDGAGRDADDDQGWPPLVGGRRVPPSGPKARLASGGRESPGPPRHRRARPGDRRRVLAGRPGRARPRGARGDRRRGRLRLAAAPHALRPWARRPAARARDRGRSRLSGRGREPDGAPDGLPQLAHPRAADARRRHPSQVRRAVGRDAPRQALLDRGRGAHPLALRRFAARRRTFRSPSPRCTSGSTASARPARPR